MQCSLVSPLSKDSERPWFEAARDTAHPSTPELPDGFGQCSSQGWGGMKQSRASPGLPEAHFLRPTSRLGQPCITDATVPPAAIRNLKRPSTCLCTPYSTSRAASRSRCLWTFIRKKTEFCIASRAGARRGDLLKIVGRACLGHAQHGEPLIDSATSDCGAQRRRIDSIPVPIRQPVV